MTARRTQPLEVIDRVAALMAAMMAGDLEAKGPLQDVLDEAGLRGDPPRVFLRWRTWQSCQCSACCHSMFVALAVLLLDVAGDRDTLASLR